MAAFDRRASLRQVAIIELDADFNGIERWLQEFDPTVTAESMSESPRDFVWYALSAEAGDQVTCERALTGVLQRLRHAAASGRFPTFRVVVGSRRSDAAAADAVDDAGMDPGPVERGP